MCSLNFQTLASEHPSDRVTLERLGQVFGPGKVYTFDRLMDLVDPPSENKLLILLGELVSKGQLHLFYRVESRRSGGIGDFENLDEIPEIIHDPRAGHDLEVTLDDVRVLYEIPSGC